MAKKEKLIKVKAKHKGYHGCIRERGDEFTITEGAFSTRWMAKVEVAKPARQPKPAPVEELDEVEADEAEVEADEETPDEEVEAEAEVVETPAPRTTRRRSR